MVIGKERARDGQPEMLAPDEARELGLKPDAPGPTPCPHCGKPLERRGISVGGKMLWVSHEACGCEGEVAQEARRLALERAEQEEERRKRLERVGIKPRFIDAELTDATCAAYVASYPAGHGIGLYIHGKVGTWKSSNASAVARELSLMGRTVVMSSAIEILSNMKETFDSRSSSKEELARYLKCEVLVLDDLGKESASPWSVMTLFDVVNTRYEAMLTTIYTSQYDLDALQRRLSRAHERETADAIVSRIRETSLIVSLAGDDKRLPPTATRVQPVAAAPIAGGAVTQAKRGRPELGRFDDASASSRP